MVTSNMIHIPWYHHGTPWYKRTITTIYSGIIACQHGIPWLSPWYTMLYYTYDRSIKIAMVYSGLTPWCTNCYLLVWQHVIAMVKYSMAMLTTVQPTACMLAVVAMVWKYYCLDTGWHNTFYTAQPLHMLLWQLYGAPSSYYATDRHLLS